jgi:hypothetical protein
MNWQAEVFPFELISHLTKRLQRVFSLSLLKPIDPVNSFVTNLANTTNKLIDRCTQKNKNKNE